MALASSAPRSTPRFDWRDKSFLTNLFSALLVVLGCVSPVGQKLLQSMGWFALSGAITNWLAIYMLFEKVPGLYGSGIIPLKFEDFKRGIRTMMMQQFFTPEHISRFLGGQSGKTFEAHILVEAIDFELLLDKLLAAVQSTSFGPMLGMFGGPDALKNMLRQPFEARMREAIQEIVSSERFSTIIKKVVAQDFGSEDWTQKIEQVVQARLDELTPDMVKEIIQDMIRSHLGWLVVWGGVFGALLGIPPAILAS